MNNGINPYQHARQLYQQTTTRNDAPAEDATQLVASTKATPATATVSKPAEVASQANGLSRGEQQMIDRYFPQSEAMTLRLYGANRSAQTLNPGAIGGRLDISG